MTLSLDANLATVVNLDLEGVKVGNKSILFVHQPSRRSFHHSIHSRGRR
jgi:hypothetical protein